LFEARRALAACALLALAACGGRSDAKGTAGNRIGAIGERVLPAKVLGLDVRAENVADAVTHSRFSYVDALSLFGLRSGSLLQATLQVSRFNSDARPSSATFRSTIVEQYSGSTPKEVVLASVPVFLSTGTQQKVAMWFRGRYFYVLSVRDDFAHPRTLLRELMRAEP
jgi:hypothetical protein